MRKSKSTYSSLNEGATTSSNSPCPTPLLKQSPLIALMASHSWDHKFHISNIHCAFHHEKASLYNLGRSNHLRDIWDELRTPLLQLRISPKIMPWLSIRIQLPSRIEGFFPYFPQPTHNLLKKGYSSPKRVHRVLKHSPKEAQGAPALPDNG